MPLGEREPLSLGAEGAEPRGTRSPERWANRVPGNGLCSQEPGSSAASRPLHADRGRGTGSQAPITARSCAVSTYCWKLVTLPSRTRQTWHISASSVLPVPVNVPV